MKFITHTISLSKPTKTIDQIVKEAQAAQNGQVKTASAAPAAQPKVVEAKFPAGHESKFKANADKLRNGGKGPQEPAAEDVNKQEKVGCKCKKGESCPKCKKAETEVEVKVADTKKVAEEKQVTYDAGKTEAKLVNDPKVDENSKIEKKADPKPELKKNNDGTETSGQPQWEGKKENVNDPFKDPKLKGKAASATSGVKLSVPGGTMVRVSNLKPAEKKKLKDYWRNEFDEDYANAMVADK